MPKGFMNNKPPMAGPNPIQVIEHDGYAHPTAGVINYPCTKAEVLLRVHVQPSEVATIEHARQAGSGRWHYRVFLKKGVIYGEHREAKVNDPLKEREIISKNLLSDKKNITFHRRAWEQFYHVVEDMKSNVQGRMTLDDALIDLCKLYDRHKNYDVG